MSRRRRVASVVGSALVVAALAGCSAFGSPYAILDAEPADDSPALPDLPGYALDGVDESTLRFAGADGDTEFWIALGTGTASVCLLAYPSETDWIVTCGGDVGPLEMSAGGNGYRVQPDGMPEPDGWTAVSENVFVRGD